MYNIYKTKQKYFHHEYMNKNLKTQKILISFTTSDLKLIIDAAEIEVASKTEFIRRAAVKAARQITKREVKLTDGPRVRANNNEDEIID